MARWHRWVGGIDWLVASMARWHRWLGVIDGLVASMPGCFSKAELMMHAIGMEMVLLRTRRVHC